MAGLWLSIDEIRFLLDRIIECARSGKIFFSRDRGGDERKKNLSAVKRFGLSDEDRIRIICGLRPDEFYGVVPERVKPLDEYEDRMYVFVANTRLQNSREDKIDDVCLYIKLQFKKPAEDGALVVSFNEAEREVTDSERHIRW